MDGGVGVAVSECSGLELVMRLGERVERVYPTEASQLFALRAVFKVAASVEKVFDDSGSDAQVATWAPVVRAR